jgi:hypothetical protein
MARTGAHVETHNPHRFLGGNGANVNEHGTNKRTRDFSVERRLTIARIYRDRAHLFLKLSLVAGIGVAVLWLCFAETSGTARHNLARYAWVSWLDWQRVETPLDLTLDGQTYHAAPATFREELCHVEYDGRDFSDLVLHSLEAGAGGLALSFAAASYVGWQRRAFESRDDVLKGDALDDEDAFQRAITEEARAHTRRRRFF